jgi:enoyl-CoA hydratase
MQSQFEFLKLENFAEAQWRITIDRPQALNALNEQVLKELSLALAALSQKKPIECRGLILTGSGEKAFVAGADIKQMSEMTAAEAQSFALKGQSTFSQIESLGFPVIAAVNGFALGGGFELALACDFIVASENAKFGLPEVSLGLIPGFGGTVRLARAAGLSRARQWIFTGDMMSAEEALKAGVVAKVVPLSELLATAEAFLKVISTRSPLAVSAAKRSALRAWDLPVEQALQSEALIFADLFKSNDVREGTKAFLEKRKPAFKGD